jgi:hypothetical protein
VGWVVRSSNPEVLQQQESKLDFVGGHTRILPYKLTVVDFTEMLSKTEDSSKIATELGESPPNTEVDSVAQDGMR